MQRQFGAAYDFVAKSYLLPRDRCDHSCLVRLATELLLPRDRCGLAA